MTFSVNPVEALWIGLNLVALVLTLVLLVDAIADRTAVRLLNGKARELAATGTVRREWFRLIVQSLLLAVAIPGLFSEREVILSPIVVMLIAIPALLLLSSFWDYIDRKQMVVLVTADVLLLRNTALDDIKEALEENTRISQQASDHADAAYHEANDVNAKIARQGAALVAQGIIQADMSEAADTTAAEMKRTVDSTAEQVHDLHEGTAPEKGK